MRVETGTRAKVLQKTSMIALAANVLLGIFKIIVGFVSGSTAVLSDAVHTFSDVFSTLIVMVGLRFSSKAADNEHPYGHQRIESIVSLILAFVLLLTAIYLSYQGIIQAIAGNPMVPSVLALGVTILSIAVKEWNYRYTMAIAKQYHSSALMSDAWHHRSDAVSSIAVLIGVGGVFLGLSILEPIATIAVSLIILKAVYDIGKLSVDQLIDRSAGNELSEQMRQSAMGIKGVKDIDLLRTRISNNVIFVDIEIAVDSDLLVSQGHEIAEAVHDMIEYQFKTVAHCMVHVNPKV